MKPQYIEPYLAWELAAWETASDEALMLFELEAISDVSETALLSEAALAEDWNRPEEDEAWSYLQPAASS